MTIKANLFEAEGEQTGLLFAVWLDPALASALALPGGEAPDQLHITLCYCGDANELSDVQIGRAISAVAEAGMLFGPITGQVAGLGRFNASESSDGKDVIYANVDVPGLAELRQFLASSLEYAGCPPLKNHGFTPHITLAYIEEGGEWPVQRIETQPLTIRSIWVVVGDKRTEVPLTGGTYKAAKAAPVPGNALKAVSKTDDELRVANYMVLFGGRDLEGRVTDRVNADGSRGEFFTKATKFDSPYTEVGMLYVDWEHGMDEAGPGRDEPLGYVDWKTARIDEKGLFVERVLNRRNKYIQYVEELFDQGVFGSSSEAIAEQVVRKANGEIVRWPLRRDTITVSPMDPRQLSENTLTAIRTLSQVGAPWAPALKAIADSVAASGDAVGSSEVSQAEKPAPTALTPEAGAPAVAQAPAADAESEALLLALEFLQLETGV